MPVHEQDQCGITVAMPADLTGRADQALHLGWRQVLPGTPIGILWFDGGQLCRKDGRRITSPPLKARLVTVRGVAYVAENSRSRSSQAARKSVGCPIAKRLSRSSSKTPYGLTWW